MKIDVIFEVCFVSSFFQCLVYGSLVDELKKLMDDDFIIEEEKGSVEIDPDHKLTNPECGHVPDKSTSGSKSSSRISNAAESDRHYPWVISVDRNHPPKTGISSCGGAIITKTAALTAGHCICGYDKDIPADMLKYVLCLGGDSKGFPPPNEVRPIEVDGNGVRNGNELTVGVGSKSQNQVRSVSILVAFVMGSFRSDASKLVVDTPPGKFKDIGLLMSRDKSRNGEDFYSHSTPSGNFAVGSLCLAAEKMMDTKDYYAGKIVTVGWGFRYSDKKSNGKPEQGQHSCTTNQFGPVEARFQQCDVNMLTLPAKKDWGCNKADKPRGYETDKCIDYLNE